MQDEYTAAGDIVDGGLSLTGGGLFKDDDFLIVLLAQESC